MMVSDAHRRPRLLLSSVCFTMACLLAAPQAAAESEEQPEQTEAEPQRDRADTADPDAAESERGEPRRLDTVRVRARRVEASGALADTPDRVEVRSGEELRQAGVQTLEDALRELPGAVSVSPAGTAVGISIDGLPASQLSVIVDGRPVGGSIGTIDGPIVDLRSLPVNPDRIDRIEIYRGVGPSGSGGASGVVIQIITLPPEDFEGDVVIGQGVTNGFDLAQRHARGNVSIPINEQHSASLRGSYLWRSPIDVNDDDRYDLPAQRTGSGGAEWSWRPNERGSLRAGVDAWGQRTDVRYSTAPPRAGAPPEDRTRTWTADAHATGIWNTEGGRRWTHITQFGRMHHNFMKVVRATGEELPRSITTHDRVRQSVEMSQPVGEEWVLEPEFVAELERVGRGGVTGTLDDAYSFRSGLGSSAVWLPLDELELSARGVFDIHSDLGVGGVAGAGASYAPITQLMLRTGVSLARRLPSAEERFLVFDHSEIGYQIEGNQDLGIETLTTSRLGFVLRDKEETMAFEVEGFIHLLDNAIEPVLVESGSTATYSYNNTGRARSGGLNASAELALPLDLHMRASWSWLPLRHSGATNEPRLLTTEHGWQGELRWRGTQHDWIGLRLRAEGRSAMEVAPGTDEAAATWTMDFAAWATVYGPVHARLEMRNILDRTDPAWGPKPGRVVGLDLGVSW